MSLQVPLIREPQYVVDFADFLPKKEEQIQLQLHQRAHQVGVATIQFFGVVITSAFQAGYLTLRYSVTSFTRLVLRSFGITDFYLAAFKVAYWVFSLVFTFVATTTRLVINKYASSNNLYLGQFIGGGINPHHIQTKGIQLDSSGVPAEVKVADLHELLRQVNFTDPMAPGYMPPTSRQEENTTYTVEELQEGLTKFVGNVNGRVAFIGTPPAHDTVRLVAFYQQIEAAVRLSIHKVNSNLAEFLQVNSDPTHSSDEVLRQYKNLLEDQARLAIDLAIAGKHCGARYMGESMSSYFSFHGDEEPSGTLEDSLIELLAAKRNEVAQGEIQKYFGTSTHGFSNYMQRMGGLLAIPGTENVIEHLSSGSFDYTRYLRSFFSVYNEDCIIDAIQEKIKKSQAFREQIMEWLKQQVGMDWRPAEEPDLQEIEVRLRQVMVEEVEIEDSVQEITIFGEILQLKGRTVHSLDEAVDFPELGESWSEFISNVFALDEAKALFNDRHYGLGLMDRMRKRQTVIQLVTQSPIGKVLERQYRESATIELDFAARTLLQQMATVVKMRAVLPVNEDSFLRVLGDEADLSEVVGSFLEQSLQVRFLEALNVGNMMRNGLPPVLLEWFLDFHQIFIPKNIERVDLAQRELANPEAYIQAVDLDGNVFQMRTGKQSLVQEALLPVLREEYARSGSKRHIFGLENDTQEICHKIFEDAFTSRPSEVILAARGTLPMELPPYSKWREVVYIQAPEIAGAILGHLVTKVVLAVISIFVIIRFSSKFYDQSTIWANRMHRYLSKEAPAVMTQAYQSAGKAYQWFLDNKFTFFFYSFIARFLLRVIPHPSARRLAGRIDPFSVFNGESYFGNVLSIAFNLLFFGWNTSSQLSSTLKFQVDRSKQERLGLYKKHCYAVWNRALEVTAN